jgi:molybdopterin converting factor small subunit
MNMKLKVILFGQLSEITGTSNLLLESITDIKGLLEALHKQYPPLATMKYIIAVDKKVIDGNMLLDEKNTVALLPPFSGG